MQSIQAVCNKYKNTYWMTVGADSECFKTDGCRQCRCKVCSHSFKYGNDHFTGCVLKNDILSTVCPDNNPVIVKECFGNFGLEKCAGKHFGCRQEGECYGETSQNHGACDCKYKPACSLGRQKLQSSFRAGNDYGYDSIEKCGFYELIDNKYRK